MGVHIVFLFIYIVLGTVLPGQYLNMLLIAQCAIALFTDKNTLQKNQFATPINIYYFCNIIISASNIVLIGNVDHLDRTSYFYIVKENIDIGSQIWVVGATMVFIGYLVFPKVTLPSLRYDISDKVAENMFKYIIYIFIIFPLVKNQLTFLGSMSKIILLPTTVGILFYSRIATRYNNKQYMRYAMILFGAQTLYAVFYSYLRFELVLPCIILFIGYFLGQTNIRSIVSAKVVPFLFAFLLFGQIFTTLARNRSNFIAAFETLYQEDDDDDIDLKNQAALDNSSSKGGLLDRSSCLAQITRVVWLTQKNGFYNGEASAPVVAALVPRILWPDKPQVMLGQWFALEAGLAYRGETGKTNNSVNLTIPGECYLDFGWIGVIIGCFLFGLFVAALWNSAEFYASEYNILGVLIGGYLLIFAIYGIVGDLQIVVTNLSVYLSFLMIKNILPKQPA